MGKRLGWLTIALTIPILALISLPLAWSSHAAQQQNEAGPEAIINEWSQGHGGSKEWVELLVVQGPLDMRGWDLGDDSAGDLTLTQDSFWSAVPAGTLIVIYNQADRDLILPADDFDPGDCSLVLPDSYSLYFSGRLPGFSDDVVTDNPHLRNSQGISVHDFSASPGTALHPHLQESVRYLGGSSLAVGDPNEWEIGPAGAASPGSGNGGSNSIWVNALCTGVGNGPDLVVQKQGPVAVTAGATITYELSVKNNGGMVASGVVLTDVLPVAAASFSSGAGYPLSQPVSGTLVWDIGDLAPGAQVHFNLTVTLGAGITGQTINHLETSTSSGDPDESNNWATVTTTVTWGSAPKVLVDAVLYDGYEPDNRDEAIMLANVGGLPADIGGWRLNDGEPSSVMFPISTTLAPGQSIWLSNEGSAFKRHFGFLPDFEIIDSYALSVTNLSGSWPRLADTGDQVILFDGSNTIIDCLVFEAGSAADCGNEWRGQPVEPYTAGTVFAAEGQILYRRRDQLTGLVSADTNTANDWAQSLHDSIEGRKVRYPGWDLERYFFTARITQTSALTIGIAPDNAFNLILGQIAAAQRSIQIETLTMEHIALGNALVDAALRGVTVTVLLEGAPPGGLADAEKHNCQRLEAAGGQCWFMVNDAAGGIFDRYRYIHAKFMIVDGVRAVISSENLSPNSLPDDDKYDGTWGRRGVVVATDAMSVVEHLQTLFSLDLGLGYHADVIRWRSDDPVYGLPSAGYVPITLTGGITYATRFAAPAAFYGTFAYEIIQSPENSLRSVDALLGLVSQAGVGDTILAEELSEPPHWGPPGSNAVDSPNPRLEAFIAAARRGASVRLLLDLYFDDPNDPASNEATCRYVRAVAASEHIRLLCALGNPTGLGLHNKMVLAHINGQGYVHVGSINGSELSSKGNRELALQLQSDGAYSLLKELFDGDWPYRVYAPLIPANYIGPAGHALITEVHYDPPGLDDKEFVEVANPTGVILDLSNYAVGDAVQREDFEDMRRFPAGTRLDPGDSLVIAFSASAFFDEYGYYPDFEVLSTVLAVPDMIDDPAWGDPSALLQLGNTGDEVILWDSAGRPVDVVTYGSGRFPGVIPCGLVTIANASLERFPYWRDTDDCVRDFREWPFPNPGSLP